MDRKKKWDSELKTMLIWKMAAASALSWEIAKAFGSNHPYLAPLSVILCLHGTVGKTVKFSLKRIAGTVIGVLLTAYIVSFVPHNGWVLGALLVYGLWISKWLKLDQVGLHQAAITILFVFSLAQSNHYAFDRIIDTVIGVAVAILIHIIYPPNLTKYASESMRQFSIKINTAFMDVSSWIKAGCQKAKGENLQKETDALLKELHQTKKALRHASDSLKFIPAGEKNRQKLNAYEREMKDLTEGYTYLSNTIKTFLEWGASGLMSSDDRSAWAEQIDIIGQAFKNSQKKIFPLSQDLNPERLAGISPQLAPNIYPIAIYQETKNFLDAVNHN
ncbi:MULTISPECIES: FUSC family protein [Bacillus]|uniref:FUSC family protein n=1 Tax=Bacillus glycinifermentans TaxID=1664069 RepID=A0AAJ3YYA1_9BACI|nr:MULTISPECIES: FUSC family protein [Bacillus]MDU0069698.1 FUSC family protein [Bacillus sp. IG6]MED8017985.1 FUSC family protein [Bacillus glycinifermentans]QAT65437.1 FUSC family protein [Bacillus glycinifermentans]WKB79442.1 FUSC family protein [Bacillus glycinifermentans]SCA86054.1 hypothetical protein BGLY_2231 [Bacillus glycinifermentans]